MSATTLVLFATCLSSTSDVARIEYRRTIELNDGIVRSVAFSPDGTIVAGCGDRFVQMFDVQTGERLHRLEGHSKPVVSIAYSPGGKLLASASEDGSIRLWDVAGAKTVRVFTSEKRPANVFPPTNKHPPRSVAFSPDGKTLIACYPLFQKRTQIILYNVESGKLFYDARQHRPEAPLHLAVSPDGAMFAVAKDSGNITLMDVVEFGIRDRLTHNRPRVMLNSAEFPSGLDSTRYPLKHDGGRIVSHVAFSLDSRKLLSCGGDNTIRVWDSKTTESLLVIKGPREATLVQAAVFSPDGSRIISVTNNEVIQLWDAHSGKLSAAESGSDDNVRGLALTPDGRTLATYGSDKVIKLWNTTIDRGDSNK